MTVVLGVKTKRSSGLCLALAQGFVLSMITPLMIANTKRYFPGRLYTDAGIMIEFLKTFYWNDPLMFYIGVFFCWIVIPVAILIGMFNFLRKLKG